MPKKGTPYNCPPKRFVTPPDIAPLKNYATVLVNIMRSTYQWRMNEVNKRKS